MTTSAYIHALGVLGVIVLLAYAHGRRRKDAGSDLTLTLIAAFVAAIVVIQVAQEAVPKANPLPYLLLVDAAVVGIAARISHTPFVALSEQAKIVAGIGFLKIAFTISAVSFGMVNNARAAIINGAFVVQVIVAGGMADGIIAWLGHRVRGLGDRLDRVFQRMGGE